jgi:hypothetical protein
MIDFDVSVPNAARMYNYFLDGKDNYAADRQAAEELLERSPDVRTVARENREFLGRAVEFAARRGISQFLDIGSGLPSGENTHQIARRVNPDARVAYVDNDLVVLSHARAILGRDPDVTVIAEDIYHPNLILADPEVRRLINLREPVAIMLVAVLHFVDYRAYQIVDILKQALPAGSCVVISHATADDMPPSERDDAQQVYAGASAPLYLRGRAEITRFFGGLELVEPGVVGVGDWPTPAHAAGRTLAYAGIGLK